MKIRLIPSRPCARRTRSCQKKDFLKRLDRPQNLRSSLFRLICPGVVVGCLLASFIATAVAEETVATSVFGRVGNGYERKKLKDGSFKPEYYALSNGGRYEGTSSDVTVDRVTYPEVAQVAMRLLTRQNYHYAQAANQAELLLVLQWGATLAPTPASEAKCAAEVLAKEAETQIINERNSRILGYMDPLSAASGNQRYAGAGTRYDDLMTDIQASRYYIVISAYDFHDLVKRGTRKMLWQTRVSVRTAGNGFDESMPAMLKGASRYFGQNSDGLVHHDESKGTVELGELRYLGEASSDGIAGGTDTSNPRAK